MATSGHMQSINRLCRLHPARQEAEPREGSGGHASPGWGWGLRRGFPWSGDIENEVMRVCVKDSWQPPALRRENSRGCWGHLWDHRHKAESQVPSPFCVWRTQPSRTDSEPENDQLRDCAQIISPSASAPGIN